MFGAKKTKNSVQKNSQKRLEVSRKKEEDLFFDWFSLVLFDTKGHLRSLKQFQSVEEVCEWLYPTPKRTTNAFLAKLFISQRKQLFGFPRSLLNQFFSDSKTIAEFQNKITDTLKSEDMANFSLL